MTYPTPDYADLAEFMVYHNEITSGWFSLVILFCFWIVVFINLKNYQTPEAFAAASFLSSIVSLLFYTAGALNGTVAMIPVILTAIAGAALYYRGE